MANNEIFEPVGKLNVPVASGTVSGDDVLVFDAIPGVALTDRDSAGNATVSINPRWVFDLSVAATNLAGNVAIEVGDTVYRSAAGVLSGETTYSRFGWALEAVTSGETDTIRVLLGDSLADTAGS